MLPADSTCIVAILSTGYRRAACRAISSRISRSESAFDCCAVTGKEKVSREKSDNTRGVLWNIGLILKSNDNRISVSIQHGKNSFACNLLIGYTIQFLMNWLKPSL